MYSKQQPIRRGGLRAALTLRFRDGLAAASLAALLVCGVAACGKSSSGTHTQPADTSIYHADDLPPVDNSQPSVTLTWDTGAVKISDNVYYAEYPRVHRVGGDTLLLTYHCGPSTNTWGNVAMRESTDNGVTWAPANLVEAAGGPGYYGFSDPDILVMKNGWLMLAFVGRGNPDDNTHDNVEISLSKDRGQTWGTPQVIVSGRSWEPGLVQLPDGSIEIFYSSEAAWWPSASPQQEILMVSTADNGATWTQPNHVAYASGDRDGMPVPVLLQGGKGIAFAIESVNNTQSPWILWSSVDAHWNYETWGTQNNGRRWLATTQPIWGGAPYLIQLPTGETLLSVQDAGGRSISDWHKNTMLVLVGNTVANGFSQITYPWPNLPTDEGAYYNSMFLSNDTTLIALTTRNFSDGHSEVWWKRGTIKR
jgi:hypothetical protein